MSFFVCKQKSAPRRTTRPIILDEEMRRHEAAGLVVRPSGRVRDRPPSGKKTLAGRDVMNMILGDLYVEIEAVTAPGAVLPNHGVVDGLKRAVKIVNARRVLLK